MAEPLKNSFGADVVERLALMVTTADPSFDSAGFLSTTLDGYDELELTPRARKAARSLRSFLPDDTAETLRLLQEALGSEADAPVLEGMEGFVYLPLVFFVAEFGLDEFEASMTLQYELTKRFTAEFSIRAFIDRHPDATLSRLRLWAEDSNVHVRRLVSEGTRPRLPWAPRLRRFQVDPAPVVELLELLKDDPELYVRRSVANNLNDIAKDHPGLVVEIARRWMTDAGTNRKALIRHLLRTLIKQGDVGALAVLGFAHGSPVETSVSLTPVRPAIGGKIRIEVDVSNPTNAEVAALVDLSVEFVKANGSTTPKVFKGGEVLLAPGASTTVRKTISLLQHTTRTHYPGEHAVNVLVNGDLRPGSKFDLVSPGG